MTQTHFMVNVPGVRPQPLRVNVPGGAGPELTEQELKEAIREAISKPLDDFAQKVQAIADRQREIQTGIAEVEADQKAHGIYREPRGETQTMTANRWGGQWNTPEDTLPE